MDIDRVIPVVHIYDYNPWDLPPSSSSGENLKVTEEYRLCRIYKRSRSLRAFDRRPLLEVAVTGDQQAEHRQQPVSELVAGDHQAAAVDHQQHHCTTQAVAINDSSSGDHNTNHENNWDNEPLWDWEDLNWFYLP
ncbi:hypothetical protein Salat_1020700 [Sesamum alatum]|uniref:NAC domain-containing protein n=1 Tax=Sesamum alatum TaxID=300844 RepID=A0AAE1YLG5_9LAMI|nr:hypothetical protein Salat_1020700 [Sesamum alatum]